MITTLLFDVDGVLAISRGLFSERLAKDYGVTREMSAAFFRQGTLYQCLIGAADLKEEIVPYLPQWGIPLGVDDFLAYWFDTENVIDHALLAAIQQLRNKGSRCYLATNQERHRTAYILQEMGFARHFDGMFSSSSIGCVKTDPAFFEHVLRTLEGVQAHEILFWDDLVENVETARKVGLQAEVYTSYQDFIEKMSRFEMSQGAL
ncbi:MAG: HAD-IA family hydrolase [Ktedonobacteraceae bacterium]|nr:HAD-IA family hydrolase [Ktedonobacteraceae bacterium]